MGSKIHSLLAPADVEESALSGKVVAIDATAWLHQFLKVNTYSTIEQERLALVDKTQRVINHLRGFLYRTKHLLRLGIWPIFVFDGVGTEKIRNAASKTDLFVAHARLARMQVKAMDEGMTALARSIGQRLDFLYPLAEQESKQLLRYLGQPVVEAPGEGEAQCTRLVTDGLAIAVVTKDADALLYGCPVVINNLAVKDHVVQKLNLKRVLSALGIARDQLVDLAILIGTDYNGGVPGVGPKTALSLLKKHGSINGIVRAEPDRDYSTLGIPDSHRPDFLQVDGERELFLRPDTIDVPTVEWTTVNVPAVDRLLLDTHSLSASLVDTAVKRINGCLSQYHFT